MSERMHLAYSSDLRGRDTRCGTGDRKAVTTDESLVTCELCLYWAHRGYTAPGRMEGKPKRRELTAEQKAVCRQSLVVARRARLSRKLARDAGAGGPDQIISFGEHG
jgi:hypothetical protein